MTEREMLELAALAYGLNHEGWTDNYDDGRGGTGPGLQYWTPKSGVRVWNPLTDDGDALRLAVKLGMSVKVDTRAGFSWIKRIEGSTPHNGDPYAATRLAITRAAAEIGKTIKEQQT